ncbi:hypothetical protein GJ496_007875 [Pomphorhynchus laevis]|nr:hypothetical protein GJ496_007875 [Pomphorhynchus laevis]
MEFQDAITVRHGLNTDYTFKTCECGSALNSVHAMSCHCGGYNFIRHNIVVDEIAEYLKGASKLVTNEPVLQELWELVVSFSNEHSISKIADLLNIHRHTVRKILSESGVTFIPTENERIATCRERNSTFSNIEQRYTPQ